MATSTLTDASCFLCLTHRQHLAIQAYLLTAIAGVSDSVETIMQNAGCVFCIPKNRLPSVQAYLMAVAKGISTDPSTLIESAKCECPPPGTQDAINTYGLADYSGLSKDPSLLMQLARCFMCLTPNQTEYLKTYLLGVWAGIDVSTSDGIKNVLEASAPFSGLDSSSVNKIQSYLNAIIGCIPPVIIWSSITLGGASIQFNWNIASDPNLDYVFYWGKTSGGPYTYSGTASRLSDGGLGVVFGGVFEYYETWYGIVCGRNSLTCVGCSAEASQTILPPIGGDTVILNDGTGNFWKVIADTSGLIGADTDPGPATPDVILNDGTGNLWKLIAATDGILGAESSAGPQTTAPLIDDGGGQLWRLVADTDGNLGATTAP